MADDILQGGVQLVASIAPQIVYLDFDGELTRYDGEILTIDNVEVQHALLSDERIQNILSILNEKYASQNVKFVTERPVTGDFSTIYIGKTSAFDAYGTFAGLAETIDHNNANKSDNAFVNLDSSATDAEIVTTISHETDHLLGTLDHGGEKLEKNADDDKDPGYIYYYYKNNETLKGNGNGGYTLQHYPSSRTITHSSYQSDGGDDYVCVGTRYNSAQNFTLAGGGLYISSGGVANETTLESKGHMYINSGGMAQKTTVNGNGYISIHSGGVAKNTTINAGGRVHIYSGGVANETMINSGIVYIYSGGDANRITIKNGGLFISGGGKANITIINSGGNVYFSGGFADDTTINSEGKAYLYYGSVNETTINSGGRIIIDYGGVANCTTINSGGYMGFDYWFSGIASNTTIHSGGCISAQQGGLWYQLGECAAIITKMGCSGITGTATNLYGSGSIYIGSGGVADSTTLQSGGRMIINSGGVAKNTTIYSGGRVNSWYQMGENAAFITEMESGAITGIATYLCGSGSITINSAGVADSTTLQSGGRMIITSGGVAKNTTIYSGGGVNSWYQMGENAAFITEIKNGEVTGTATHLCASSGSITIGNGGTANSTMLSGYPWYRYFAQMTLKSGGVANETTITALGAMYISSGGVANETTINAGGIVYISSGGVANETTINDSGKVYILSGGVANETTINSWGHMYIYSGGVANSTTFNSGFMTISSGGVANNATINSWGGMYISSGGVANSTTINSGGAMWIYDGIVSKTTINSGSMGINSGGVANSTTINSGGAMWIYDGIASKTTINSGGDLILISGGVAKNTTINSGGTMLISFGGVANEIILSSGGRLSSWLQHGETAASITAMTGFWLTGTATNLNGSGSFSIISGGVASKTTINSGSMGINSGGVAKNTTINSGGSVYISSGGVANEIILSSGGRLGSWMQNGETAASITAMTGSGLTGTATNLNGSGTFSIISSGVANETTINYNGSMYISSGGVASKTTVTVWGHMFISSGGVANETTINSYGYLHINSGGVANETTINSGWVYISSGGVAERLAVRKGGSAYIYGTASLIYDPWSGYISSGTGALIVTCKPDYEYYLGNYNSGTISRSNGVTGQIISSGLSAVVFEGAVRDTTVLSGGVMNISSTASFKDNIVRTLALAAPVPPSGVTGNTADGGVINVHGNAVDNLAKNKGSINVYAMGIAENNTIVTGASITVYEDGMLRNTVIEEGGNLVAKNAHLYGTTINGTGNISGGITENITVNAGGNLTLHNGAMVRGLTTNGITTTYTGVVFEKNIKIRKQLLTTAPVAMGSDAVITFVLDDKNDTALTNSYDNLSGCKKFCMENQSAKKYWNFKLIKDAEDFNTTIDYFNQGYKLWEITDLGMLVRHNDNSLNFFKYVLPKTWGEFEEFLGTSEMWKWQFSTTIFELPDFSFGSEAFGRTVNNRKWLRFSMNSVRLNYSGSVSGDYEFTLKGNIELTAGIVTVKADLASSEDYGVSLRYGWRDNPETKELEFTQTGWDLAGKFGVKFQQIDHRYKLFAHTYTVEGSLEIDTKKNTFIISGELYTTTRASITVTADFSGITLNENAHAEDRSVANFWNNLKALSFEAKDTKWRLGCMTIYTLSLKWKQEVVSGKTIDYYSGNVGMTFGDFSVKGKLAASFKDVFDIKVSAELNIAVADITVNGKVASSGDFAMYGNVEFLSVDHKSLINTSANMYIAHTTNGTEETSDDITFASGKLNFADIITANGSLTLTDQQTTLTIKGTVKLPKIFQWFGAAESYDGGLIYEYKSANEQYLTIWGFGNNKWYGSKYNFATGKEEKISKNKMLQNEINAVYEVVRINEEAIARFSSEESQTLHLYTVYQGKTDANIVLEINNNDGTGFSISLDDYKAGLMRRSLAVLNANGVQLQIENFSESEFNATLTGDTAGTWNVSLRCPDDIVENVLFAMETEEIAVDQLSIDQVLLKADSLTLGYTCQTTDDSGNGKIYLYYDSDNQGFDGKFITELDYSGSHTMDFAVNQWLNSAEKGYFYMIYSGNSIPTYSNYYEVTNPLLIFKSDESGLEWDEVSQTAAYTVEYSVDNFATALLIKTSNNNIDSYGLPEGTYQWQIHSDSLKTAPGDDIISTNINDSAKTFVSDEDGNMDLFFAEADGKWIKGYTAEHHGILYGWDGTGERVSLNGKNQLNDIFAGSSDANILVMTDDANGDTLFVDDMYSIFGDQARIAQIKEIRAGAGDDVIDMTSQRFAYSGDGVKIYGGLGDDVIWANNGSNTLFGDAGNDRIVGGGDNDVIIGGIGNDSMHGGGGDDVFCFGCNWGNDTIEQLSGGSVTLWFEQGSVSNWNASTMTYSDGINSIKVSGVDNVTLKFGDVNTAVAGAFLDAASEKIFEDRNSGMIA